MLSNYQGDWDIRGADLDQRYARFSREPLTDDEIMWLSMASKVIPTASIGDKLFLTSRSACDCYMKDILAWGEMVADSVAFVKYKAKRGQNRRTYVEGYQKRWGHQAARDGLYIAMFGPKGIPGTTDRSSHFGIGKQGYARIRDFVGGASVMAMEEYKFALLWSMGRIRDKTFDFRWDCEQTIKNVQPAPRHVILSLN